MLALALGGQHAFGGLARLALLALVAAVLDDAAQHVVGEFHPARVETLLDAQQPAVHEQGHGARQSAGGRKAADQTFLGHVLAEARSGQQLILDDAADGGGLVLERPLIKVAEDRGVRAGQQVEGNLGAILGDARVVQLAADQAQQRGLDLGIGQFGAAGHEPHDGGGHFFGHQSLAGPHDRGHRLDAGHRRQPQAVLGDARHRALEAFERRQIVLTQRDQHAIVAAGEIEALGHLVVGFQLGLDRLGRAVFNQIGQVGDEGRGAGSAEVIALRQREDLLELIEDQQRDQSLAGFVAQHVVAVMQELPQRLASIGHPDLGPLAGAPGGAGDGLLDLFGGLGRVTAVVDAHVDRAITLVAQTRHQAGTQYRGLAQARLAEQHRQELALHPAGEFGDLVIAAVEIGARFFGKRGQPEPRMACIDRWLGRRLGARWRPWLGIHCWRARMKSIRR